MQDELRAVSKGRLSPPNLDRDSHSPLLAGSEVYQIPRREHGPPNPSNSESERTSSSGTRESGPFPPGLFLGQREAQNNNENEERDKFLELECNRCDEAIPDVHYHCKICDDDDYDICEICAQDGLRCKDDGHWMMKRILHDGKNQRHPY